MNENNSEQIQDKNGDDRRSRRNLLFAVLSLLVCLSIPISAILGSQSSFGRTNDFPEYYSAMKMVCSGHGAEIYKLESLFKTEHELFPNMQGRGIGYYIPPFSTPLLLCVGLPPAQTSYWFYIAASFISLLAACLLLGRTFKLGTAGTIWLMTIIFATGPAFEALKIAQPAPFLYFAFAGFLHFVSRRKDLSAALCLSVLLLKPQEMLPLAIYTAACGRLKLIAYLLVILGVLALLSLPLLGTAGYANYAALLKDSATNTQFMQPELSATFRGQLLRFNDPLNPFVNTMSLAALFTALFTIAYQAIKRGKNKEFLDGLLSVALPLGLLSALHCHDYDLLLLAPWFVAVWQRRKSGALARASKLFAAFFVIAFAIPFYVPIHYGWLLQQGQPLNPYFILFALAAIFSLLNFTKEKDEVRAIIERNG